MRTIAIWNQKGGSGKSTTAVNLAAALAELGFRILLFDLDPQHNTTGWYGIADGGKDLLLFFRGDRDLASIVRPTAVPGVDIVPSSAWLLGAEKVLLSELDGEFVLAEGLKQLPATWDFIIFDCPPALGQLTTNALCAATELLVPVEAHILAVEGLADLGRRVEWIQAKRNPDLRLAGVLVCRVDARTRHAQEVTAAIRARYEDLVYPTVIRENVRLAECPSFSKPITQYDSRSNGAADYRALAVHIVAQESAPQEEIQHHVQAS